LRAIAKHRADRFADAASFSRELLVTMAKMCLPVDLMATQGDIAIALSETRPRAPLAPPRPESGVVGPTPVEADSSQGPPQDAATILACPGAPASTAGSHRTDRVYQPETAEREAARTSISGTEVLLSAAAFAIVAGGVAMWFVH
jgi:hypothetical protein